METKSTSKIFNQVIFRVPDYQRGYSWTWKHLEQFWDDLKRLREDQDHYTGLLTIEEAKDTQGNQKWDDVQWIISTADYKPYYIVDGQQRLTTIILLIQSIIEKIKDDTKLNLRSKSQIKEQYICISDENLKAYIFGYEKDDPSYEFLKTTIFKESSSNSLNTQLSLYTKNLKYAKSFFDNKIAKHDTENLEDLFRKVTLRLKFNLYEIENDLDVFVMFETMNNRGKPLSKLEILKNRLIYLSSLLVDSSEEQKSEIRNRINNSWRTIYEYLGKNPDSLLDDDEFLKNHTYMFFNYMGYDKSDLFADFLLNRHFNTDNVYLKKITLKGLERYSASIQNSIIKWFDIKFPYNEMSNTDSSIKNELKKLSRLRSAYFWPSIMGALLFQDTQGNRYGSQQILRLLKAMEKFSFLSFNVFQRNSSYKKNQFFGHASKIYSGEMSISDYVLEIEDASRQQPNSLTAFHYHLDRLFDNPKKPGFYGWNGLNYFLYEYEKNLQGREEEKTTWDKAKQPSSIEHIYPRTPNEDWTVDFKSYTEKQREILCNSLGNLLLISQRKNSSLQNKGFEFKKQHSSETSSTDNSGYFNGSHSEINIAKYDKWTADEILERGLKMLQFMQDFWGITFGGEHEMKKILFLDFIDNKS